MTEPIELPDKIYFRVGEVSKIADVPAYVLRFWEKEFRQIRPKRTDSGQRLYRKQDVERILAIKDLLYNRRFTIQGARQHLKAQTGPKREKAPALSVAEIRRELESIRDLLD